MATAFGRTLTNVTRAQVSMRSLVSIVEKRTVVRARDLYRSGIHPEVVSRALQRGLLLKIGPGLSTRLSSDLKYRQISSKIEAKQLCLDDVAAAGTSVQSGEQDDVRVQRSLW